MRKVVIKTKYSLEHCTVTKTDVDMLIVLNVPYLLAYQLHWGSVGYCWLLLVDL